VTPPGTAAGQYPSWSVFYNYSVSSGLCKTQNESTIPDLKRHRIAAPEPFFQYYALQPAKASMSMKKDLQLAKGGT
jgi:hypothetical protein